MDRWGDMHATEILRQWLTYGGWYNPKSCSWNTVKNITFAATLSLKSFKEILDARLSWNFAIIGFVNLEGSHIE